MSKFHHIPEEFFDEEYLYAYAEDFFNTKIATQLRVLREQRGFTQEELAQKIGTKQPGIARLENVNYSAWKIGTLKKCARAFGVVFIGGFVSLRTFLEEEETFGRKMLEQQSYKEQIAEQEKNSKDSKDIYTSFATPIEVQGTLGAVSPAMREKITGKDLQRQKREQTKQLVAIDHRTGIFLEMANYMRPKSSHEKGEMPYAALGNFSR